MRLIIVFFLMATAANAANFVGDREAVDVAEKCRAEFARYWFGREFPEWAKPCKITLRQFREVKGATTFAIHRGHVFGWDMNAYAPTKERAIREVVPHEVNHTVFATFYRRKLPRWIDEGAACFVETVQEKDRLRAALKSRLNAGRTTPFWQLFANSGAYPSDSARLENVYLQGFAAVEFLINGHPGGRTKFVEFVADCFADSDGSSIVSALRSHYGYDSAADFESAWLESWKAFNGEHSTAQHYAGRGSFAIEAGIEFRDFFGALAPLRLPECRIEVYSGRLCIPCQRWKSKELPKLNGIPIFIIEDNPAANAAAGVKSYPAFICYHKGKEVGRLEDYQSAERIRALWGRCNPGELRPSPVPKPIPKGRPAPSVDSSILLRLDAIAMRIESLEMRPEHSSELRSIRAQLAEFDRRLVNWESVKIPVRIETSSGKLIREKSYPIQFGESGAPSFAPIVLKFDERILRGEAGRK